MKYSLTAFDKAQALLSKRRKDAADELFRREQQIFADIPEVKELKASISNTYFELVQIIASHEKNAAQAAEAVKAKNLDAQKRIKALCEQYTGDPDFLDPLYVCEKCKDTGYVEGIRCSCFEDMLKKFTVEELNERTTIALHDFSEYDENYYPIGDARNRMNSCLTYFKNYCLNFPNGCRSMLFEGQTGLGKTFLSSCIAKSVAQRGYLVAFGSVSDFLRQIENEHFNNVEGDTLGTLIEADLVIIDDLGSEFISPFYESTLYNIINSRMNLKRPTIISTNMNEPQINSRYNERICSRILNYFMPIHFSGEDIRQQIAQAKYGR
ncbi:MAG: ATP-binding protein [Oscillospiraceae bacterium]